MGNVSKVLSLKYRPKTFSDLIGQDVMVETIINSIKINKLPNAYLFTGIRGVGKTTTARIIAKALNCKKGVENLCDNEMCENCNSIANSNHIDCMEFDAASKTGVDDIRDLIEFSKYGPSTAKYKIFIIDEVHMLSKQAFNALLKTLEEPPSYLKFIFATTEVRKVPVTVLSRCQRFDLMRVKSDLLLKFLKKITDQEKGKISEEALKLIVKISEGSVRDSLSLLDRALITNITEKKELDLNSAQKIFGYFNKSHLIELMKSIFEGKEEETLIKFRHLTDMGIDPKIFLNDFLEILYLMKNIKIFDEKEIVFSLSDTEIKVIEQLSSQIDIETLIMYWQFTLRSLEELNIVANQNLSIEMFLIRLIHLKKIPKLEDLLNNLEIPEKITLKGLKILSKETNETRETIFQEKKQSADQIKNITQEKKSSSNLNEAVELIDKSKISYETIRDFENLIDLCSKRKENVLKYDLEKNVRLVKFFDGYIEFSFDQNVEKGFIKNLSKKLYDWTGKRWILTLSREKGLPTLQETKLKQNLNELQEATNTEVYKKTLKAFPDAKLISVEPKGEKND